MFLKLTKYDDREIAWLYEFSHPYLKELLITYVETQRESLKSKLVKHNLRFWKTYSPEYRVFLFFALSLAAFVLSFQMRKPLYLWKMGYIDRRVNVRVVPKVVFLGENAFITIESKSPFRERVFITGPDTQEIHIPPFEVLRDTLSNLKTGVYVISHDGSPMETLRVITRPLIESLMVFLENPYFHKVDTIIDDYKLEAIEGSKVFFRVIHNGDSVLLQGVDSILLLISDTSVGIRLFKAGRSYVYPQKISIKMIRDGPPVVRILVPMEKVVYLPEDGYIPLGAVSMDDFGLSMIYIKYEFGNSRGVLMKTGPDSPLRDTFLRYVNLNAIPMLPGDEMRVIVEAVDVGGQSSSDYIIVRFPTLREQMEMSEEELSSSSSDIEETFRRAEELSQNIDRIHTMDVNEIRNMAEHLREIRKQMEEISQSMKEISQSLPMDEEMSELLERITELYEKIIDEDMRSILQRLQQLSDTLSPSQRKALMEKIRRDMGRLKESLRSTYETLKRFYQEQKLKHISQRMEELAKDQAVALDTIDERRIMEEMEKIRSEIDSISGSIERPFRDSMMDLSTSMDSLIREMENSIRSASDGRMHPKDRKMLSEGMQKLSKKMSRLTSSIISSRKARIMERLDSVREQVAFLMYNSSAEDYGHQKKVVDGLKFVIKELKEIMPRNFLISASIYGYLYSALENAEEALVRFDFLDKKGAVEFIERERKDMFLSLLEIQKSMNQIASSGSSTGFQEMLKQMSKSIGEQASLNNRLQMMIGKGRIPMDILREMARQQSGIRRRIESMAQKMESMDGRGRMYSRMLREIASEMEELEKRLLRGDVDRKLIERQRRILNRLMEAYTGLKSERMEKKREAERARPYQFRPPSVPEEILLRKKIMDIMRSYPGERRILNIYREIIRTF